MANKLAEKRHFVWSIKDFTGVGVYQGETVTSDSFEIQLGNNNTKWHFEVDPNSYEQDFCEFCIIREEASDENFSVSLKLAVRASDNQCVLAKTINKPATAISPRLGCFMFNTSGIFIESGFHLPNDTLTIVVSLKLYQHEPPKVLQANVLSDVVVNLLSSESFSDITIVCSDGMELRAHRAVLAGRSSVFKAMLSTEMLENKYKKISIDDIDGGTMLEVLRYIYTNEVDNLKHTSKILYAAEKYDLLELKQLCVSKMMSKIADNNVFEFLVTADIYKEDLLLDECMEFIYTNLQRVDTTEYWMNVGFNLMAKYVRFVEAISAGIIPFTSTL